MSLLKMSVAGAVMILAIIVIRALAINRVPKKTFLALWDVALMRLLIPFSLPSGMSIYSLLKRKNTPVIGNTPAMVLPAVPSGYAVTVVPQKEAVSAAAIPGWSIVWAAGLILCAVIFGVAYWKCYQEFKISLPVDNDVSRRWLQAHPLRRKIAIRQSDRISSPLTFGVLHPVILVPKKMDWEDENALRYVLEHEFVHIQRFDTVSKLLLVAAVCVHWFNPMVWGMYILANRDIELSCDETVVRHFGSDTRASYAKVLISMEEKRSGFAPLCNHFSRNAIEERIVAIMKVKKPTIISLTVAAILVAGTATVFATSAKNEEPESPTAYEGSAENAGVPAAAGTAEAVESDEGMAPAEEYLSAGITYRDNVRYYQEKPIEGMYDDNGGIYMDGSVEDGIYLHVERNSLGSIEKLTVITRKQYRELVDRHMNLYPSESVLEENTVMSYIDPTDGKTYYSFDNGETFEPMTDAEVEALYPTQDIEWWTYDEYKAWLDNEKVQLQSMLGEKGWTSGDGDFVWTQEKINETIAMYESILEDIRNGKMYSKSVDGDSDMLMMSYDPSDIELGTSTEAKELYIKLDNGEEHTFGPYETKEELLAEVKPFCEEQVKLGNMTQSEADEIISRYTQN